MFLWIWYWDMDIWIWLLYMDIGIWCSMVLEYHVLIYVLMWYDMIWCSMVLEYLRQHVFSPQKWPNCRWTYQMERVGYDKRRWFVFSALNSDILDISLTVIKNCLAGEIIKYHDFPIPLPPLPSRYGEVPMSCSSRWVRHLGKIDVKKTEFDNWMN